MTGTEFSILVDTRGKQMDGFEIDVNPAKLHVAMAEIHRDKNLFVVEAAIFDGDEEFSVVESRGIARRNPEDHPDREVAEKLAIGRALQNLGTALLRQANGRVKMIDDLATGKVNSSTKKTEVVKVAKKATKKSKKAAKKATAKAKVFAQP